MDRGSKRPDGRSTAIIYTALTEKAMKVAYRNTSWTDRSKRDTLYLSSFYVAEQMDDELSVCAALLHDVIEDKRSHLRILPENFRRKRLWRALRCLTRDKNMNYFDYIRKLRKIRSQKEWNELICSQFWCNTSFWLRKYVCWTDIGCMEDINGLWRYFMMRWYYFHWSHLLTFIRFFMHAWSTQCSNDLRYYCGVFLVKYMDFLHWSLWHLITYLINSDFSFYFPPLFF